jgi:hypothetical protein
MSVFRVNLGFIDEPVPIPRKGDAQATRDLFPDFRLARTNSV